VYIHNKYKKTKSKKDIRQRIKDTLERMVFNDEKNYVFMMDTNGNAILTASNNFKNKNLMAFEDADGRSIILEEIQKVRKYGDGFLRSRLLKDRAWQVIYVKALGFDNLYIGSSIYEIQQKQELKNNFLNLIKKIPVGDTDFVGLYDDKKAIYLSNNMRKVLGDESLKIIANNLSKDSKWISTDIDGYIYYTKYYEPFDWYLIYGFNILKMNQKELLKYKALESMLDDELDTIIKASAMIVFLIVLLSLLLSRKINTIFKEYQKEVEVREEALLELNQSLEQRVKLQVEAHIEKDKMLIQQSKMAEMGDMLSMIAHQWRQPLNQMSYVLMNIQASYEHNELTKDYLNEKINEGNNLLEFMSTTIDDFKNYFRPDKEKEFVLVSDVILSAVNFMKKSLEMDGVEIVLEQDGRELTHIYKNEFIQVVLNLIKNAKDALVQNRIYKPKIIIKSKSLKDSLIVSVCDNGGGIEDEIIEEIFKPYFSTKDKKQGTGLGLYMSKMIIEEHIGGRLSVSNILDTDNEIIGACFKIEI
jgi:signal transduction histidine kinase